MTEKKRRRRARKMRCLSRILKGIAIAVVVLGLIGLGVTLFLDQITEKTVQRYPMNYTDWITEYARAEGIEPAYVASVILAESSYDPQAVSSVNAQGLMQILPSTGEWIAGKFDESYVEGCLFDPETNIRYGCWYLGFLMERYGGDKRCSSAAYHAGQGRVDQWLQNPAYSQDGKTLDVIEIDATSTYVDRVLKYYEKYKQLYETDVPA